MDKRMGFEAGAARTLLGLTAYLGALALWFRVGLPLEGPPARMAGSVLFLAAVWLLGFAFERRGLFAALATGAVVLALAPLRPGPEGAALLAAGLAGAASFQARPDRRPMARALFGGAVLFAAFMLARQAFPMLWSAEQWLAAGYSGTAGALLDLPLRWAASALGLHIVLAGASLLVAATLAGALHPRRALLVALALPVLPLIHLLVALPHGMDLGSLSNGGQGTAKVFALQVLIVPALALLVTWARRGDVAPAAAPLAEEVAVERAPLGHAVAAVAAPALLFAFGAAAEVDAADRAQPERVLLHSAGVLADFNSASWDRFGYGTQGMYGHLPGLLEATGREVVVHSEPLEDSDLAGVDTLVLIVPVAGEVPAPATIERFVADGGSLLLMSDHTDLFGSAAVSNELLEPFGIELRFDTVMESAGSFEGNLEVLDNGVYPTTTLPDQFEILHGASLRVTGPAEPVVVGKLMFGDIGDRSKGGKDAFLGDYRLDPRGEQVGDLVLVAKAEHGAGRVLVYGDTSGFQNVSLPRSSASVLRTFDWLSGEDVGAGGLMHLISLLGGTLAFAALKRRRDLELRSLGAALGLVWFFGGAGANALDNAALAEELDDEARIALVHSNTFGFADGRHFTDESFDGLLTNAARGGLIPLVGDPAGASDPGRFEVIFVLPTAALDAGQAERLTSYVEGGGTLVVAAGHEEGAGSAALLAGFGFEVLGVPMGAAPVLDWKASAAYTGVQFDEAWPVVDIAPELGPVTSHFAIDGLDLVVERAHGAGRVLVIGDSWFLSDVNLEAESDFSLPNIHFLADLLGWS